ncbi:MAG: DUF1343 domain-containing protein [Myxococcota bacterium]
MSRVRTGLECLLEDDALLARLRSSRVGLLVNPTAVTSNLVHAIDALQARGVTIDILFGPEHGVRAEAQDMEAVEAELDPISGIRAVSLYGHTFASLEPAPADVQHLDVVLADIQDVGARYYTYCYTIGLMMKVCGQVDTEVWVLDRPNPIGGEVVEGNVVLPECVSFVGMQPLATRHGMTIGELATFFDMFCGWSCALTVVECQGWTRDLFFDDTRLPWVYPSPNMPTLTTATIYPGMCLLEGTQMSEGRGTTKPFEVFGAPWVEPVAWYHAMVGFGLEGAAWRTTSFKPMFQKHAGQICRGLQLHVTDRRALRSLEVALCILSSCLRLFPDEFSWRAQAYEFVDDVAAIDLLLGDPAVREALEAGEDPREVSRHLETTPGRALFDERRREVLRYA